MAASGPVARSFAGTAGLTREQLLQAPVHWPRPSVLDASLKAIEGVGPRLAEAAAEAGIATLGDLLLRFPHSHRDRTVTPVAALEPGKQMTIRVEVLSDATRPFRRRGLSILTVKVGDASGHVRATWFNQPWLTPKLTAGTGLLLTGSRDKRGFRVSEYELLPTAGPVAAGDPPPPAVAKASSGAVPPTTPPADERGALVPVHPATEALKAQRIRQWVEAAMPLVGNTLEALPAELRVRREIAGVADAVKAMHFPASPVDIEQAR